MTTLSRVGDLSIDQFAESISGPVGDSLSGTFEPVVAAGTTLQYYRGDKTWQTLNAAAVVFAPAGSLSATTVQAAIEELDLEKAAASHTHVIADVTGLQAALDDKAALAHTHVIADVTGLQAALDAKLDDTQATAFGLSLLDDADAATARTTLGLGTSATVNTGTSGATVALCNGANTWGANNNFSSSGVPVTINSTNSNAYKFNFQRAGATDAYFGSNATYLITAADSGVVDRFGITQGATPELHLNSSKVVTTRRTGWSAASGTATRSTYDTATVTLPQLAERLKALIDDLITHGLIGA